MTDNGPDGTTTAASRNARVLRVLGLVVFAVVYSWVAPEFFGPRRYEAWSWPTFLGLHAVMMIGAITVALGRQPLVADFVLAGFAALTWAYLFIFVWFNSWGT
jgi:hypothetical protein